MLAIAQLRCTADVHANFLSAQRLVRQAVTSLRADFVCLPENLDYIGGQNNPHALTHDSPFLKQYCELAKSSKVWLSLGGMHEDGGVDGSSGLKEKQYNTHIILDSEGSIRAKYRKIHMFDSTVDGGWRESNSTAPGDEVIVVRDTPIGNVGLSTCFDVRFPTMYQLLVRHGAQVILVPSAFMPTTGKAHWEVLLRCRAIETQCYVAAAAQCGAHHATRSSYGHSMICGPFGEIMVDLGGEANEGAVGACQIDLAHLHAVREAMPMKESGPWKMSLY